MLKRKSRYELYVEPREKERVDMNAPVEVIQVGKTIENGVEVESIEVVKSMPHKENSRFKVSDFKMENLISIHADNGLVERGLGVDQAKFENTLNEVVNQIDKFNEIKDKGE